ncbi:TIGR04282 family arsenosugar biosynthesis glycosyltransferase, partial [Chamaesiphon sp. VAR_48_metabat_135_sub]|uniref:TIGR04282 family arsenosugar biosynthesis glycosyltransferase n=1 Tax=Chamaesiphon sp. VAR_48_metabat_135_sub TaxID=2964699 RepID=UPI00286C7EB9
MINSETTLIIFTRYPTPGAVKTRLIPAVGAAGAAMLHRQMTENTLCQARKLNRRIEIHFDGSDSQQMADWLGTDLVYQSQGAGDLGVRMDRSISSACQEGDKQVILIGTDCPELTTEILAQAFELLLDRDLVLGAALDGGYYLIGIRHPQPALFVDIDWGTDRVLQQTIDIAQQLNLSIGYLPKLADIDRPEDLPLLTQLGLETKISIVIPALNEAGTIAKVLAGIHSLPNVEIILVDGGSSDDTVSISTELGVKVISADKGRARQMNVGAKAATGEILLFLHADTFLPFGFETMVRSTLQPCLREEKHDRVLTSLLDFVLGWFTPPTPPYKGGAFAPSPWKGEGCGGVKDYAKTQTDSSVRDRPIAG